VRGQSGRVVGRTHRYDDRATARRCGVAHLSRIVTSWGRAPIVCIHNTIKVKSTIPMKSVGGCSSPCREPVGG